MFRKVSSVSASVLDVGTQTEMTEGGAGVITQVRERLAMAVCVRTWGGVVGVEVSAIRN